MTEWVLVVTAIYAIGFEDENLPTRYSFPMEQGQCLYLVDKIFPIYDGGVFQIARCVAKPPKPSEWECPNGTCD
jgi:hypothetical protein